MEPKRLIKRVNQALVAGGKAADSRAEVEAHQEKGLILLIIREGRRVRRRQLAYLRQLRWLTILICLFSQ